jgi:hypothetical protein
MLLSLEQAAPLVGRISIAVCVTLGAAAPWVISFTGRINFVVCVTP